MTGKAKSGTVGGGGGSPKTPKTKGPGGLPSKKPGKKSGPGRDNVSTTSKS